jgi:predicted metal-dependent HD superfamily phosphohydrolase
MATALLKYLDNDRHYHTFAHIGYMMENLQLTFPEHQYDRVLKAAIAYHDCVYLINQPVGTSENVSAKAAERELADANWGTIERREVARLIRLTINHHAAEDDLTGKILIDLDLAGLASDMYWTNKDWIRQEFKSASDEQWREGRIKFLESFLSRDYIYQTSRAIRRWESLARENMTMELEDLQEN